MTPDEYIVLFYIRAEIQGAGRSLNMIRQKRKEQYRTWEK